MRSHKFVIKMIETMKRKKVIWKKNVETFKFPETTLMRLFNKKYGGK